MSTQTIPKGKWEQRKAQMRAMSREDMMLVNERANLTLLANLRRAMPHAILPKVNYVQAELAALWWPLTNAWGFAVDQARLDAGLSPTRPDSDPEESLRELLDHEIARRARLAA